MDWSKAKTILIVAFIITNILLVFMLIREKPGVDLTINDEFIEDVLELLKDKDISVATQIPKDKPYLNTMIVGYEKVDIKGLNENFFNNEGAINDNREGLGEIVKDYESIVIVNRKLITYENKGKKENYPDINKDKAIQIAEEFLKDKGFPTSDIKLTYIKEEEGVFYLEYSKLYEDVLVERAFTNLQIDERGVKRLERLWLNIKDLGETEIHISTAPKSILGLLSKEEVYGKTITDISLCYYFDPQRHDYLEEPGDAKQGKAIPAWRIQFSDGYKVFIDEY